MNGERTNAGDVGSLKRPAHCVLEQAGSDAPTVPRTGNCETCKQHDRNRMTGEAFGQTLRCAIVLDLTDHECIVAYDVPIRGRNVGLRCLGLLILQGIAFEEAIQRFASAVEVIDLVTALQFFNAERPLRVAALEHTRFGKKPSQTGRWTGRRRERCLESLPLLSVEAETLAIGKRFLGA